MRVKEPKRPFDETLEVLENAFRHLEAKVPPPNRMPWRNGFVVRYTEKTIQQAIIQKLARSISGLYAVDLLLDRGLFQEQGMVQRALDEIDEDIEFLSLGIIYGDVTALHQQYLNFFMRRSSKIHRTSWARTRAEGW